MDQAALDGAVLPYEAYTVAWVCAIKEELTAARYMLERKYELPYRKSNDNNNYVVGHIYRHNVVIACLPTDTGPGAALSTAMQLERSFPNIAIRLMVGIGGGVPKFRDVRCVSSIRPWTIISLCK